MLMMDGLNVLLCKSQCGWMLMTLGLDRFFFRVAAADADDAGFACASSRRRVQMDADECG